MMENSRNIAPTGIRFPEQLKEIIKKAAKEEGRSLNSEVIKRIERSLKEDGLLQV
ncbi:TPA: Arc family DNA-binding protein [Salmonella enterica]|uniref:Arc family DNA-binding protein n=3 Tax=Salmonella enterica TaxID=28901 RepID=A0A754ASQ9_SALER|nr:Arc family DNA-binding protein [Salmonella enterica]EDV7131112.1 Arc family DNA-binding protein [Salmonella enterica subsp. enterica serovar Abortusequi]EFQ9519962.1 Arc family DNA-binding protein [Salmonella enterica]EFR7366713.1 Arc family DNA-binding protein [Salmonella enterica]QVX74141.1 Arc family DNA-binding protein [Salmonella enterica subsp. enterica serovar Abortusequi]HAA0791801.1 Arc family DNA-binding protein [Salmonella enterica]